MRATARTWSRSGAAACVTTTICAAATIRSRCPASPSRRISSRGVRLASWSEHDFIRVMRNGITPGGRVLDAEYLPWPFFAAMTDEELQAIWRYLRESGARL